MPTNKPMKLFSSAVSIPCAGDEDGILEITFKYKGRSHVVALEKSINDINNKSKKTGYTSLDDCADCLMPIIESWGIPEELTRDNVIKLLDNYPRAFDSIIINYTQKVLSAGFTNH